ncbi:UNVERIFIED_CONTAM: hypothetical protein Sradi_1302500 [Sesamum radiatum]|uniref:Uncharacterized protein n=1 Tax=Sesamum radiatum TaxID=300843 RepID=A0AAW2URH3_SESRA
MEAVHGGYLSRERRWRGGRGGGEKPLLESHLPSRRSAGAATAAAASFLVAYGTSGFGFGFGVAVRVGVWGEW